MELLQSLLYNFTHDQKLIEIIIYVISAAAGITLAMALYYLTSGTYSPVRQHLQRLIQGESHQTDEGVDYKKFLEHNLAKLGDLPMLSQRLATDTTSRNLLIHAGFHSENALKVYYAIRLVSVLLALFGALALFEQFPQMSTTLAIYLVALILGLSYLLPRMALRKAAQRRMNNLRRYFPDALDLLVVCSESGLGLLESFARVGKELQMAHPDLSHEINLVCSKVRVGISIQQALKEFSNRTGLEDIRGLNSVIVQSLKLGTGIAETLRVYAAEYRDKRLQEAEEKAAKLGVKLIFPMMFCIWPSFFIVAIGPAILKIMNIWHKAF